MQSKGQLNTTFYTSSLQRITAIPQLQIPSQWQLLYKKQTGGLILIGTAAQEEEAPAFFSTAFLQPKWSKDLTENSTGGCMSCSSLISWSWWVSGPSVLCTEQLLATRIYCGKVMQKLMPSLALSLQMWVALDYSNTMRIYYESNRSSERLNSRTDKN